MQRAEVVDVEFGGRWSKSCGNTEGRNCDHECAELQQTFRILFRYNDGDIKYLSEPGGGLMDPVTVAVEERTFAILNILAAVATTSSKP